MTPVEERIEATGGVEIAVRRWTPEEPSRRAVVLVHGLASNARLWDGVARRLAERGHPVGAVDQRGHGRSDKPDGPYDMTTVVADLVAVCDGLGFERPYLVGQSWGGNVVIETAASHPGRTSGVAAVDGGWLELQGRFPTWEACRDALAPPRFAGTPLATFEPMMRRMHPDWPEEGIQGALGNVEVRADGTVAPWLTFERHLDVLRGMWEHRPSLAFGRIVEPVLLIPCDTGDVGWTMAKRAEVEVAERAIARCRTVWFTADHDVHAQHPDDVAALIAEEAA